MNEKIQALLAMAKSNRGFIVEKATMVVGAILGILVVAVLQGRPKEYESVVDYDGQTTQETQPE
jgi:hypothetical protein